MTLKCDEKFEEKLPLGSRNNMRNLVNFNGSGGKSEDFPFDVLFLSKVFYVLVKKKRPRAEKADVKKIYKYHFHLCPNVLFSLGLRTCKVSIHQNIALEIRTGEDCHT